MTDITTELIEKAAQAVWEDRYPDIPFEDVNEHNVLKLSVYGHARAALASIWPDVERMRDAIRVALDCCDDNDMDGAWRILRAALRDTENTP